jgi:hypothetical protein
MASYLSLFWSSSYETNYSGLPFRLEDMKRNFSYKIYNTGAVDHPVSDQE